MERLDESLVTNGNIDPFFEIQSKLFYTIEENSEIQIEIELTKILPNQLKETLKKCGNENL